ncbi:peroxisome biogenesis factor 10 isoform X1 [Vigna radiata var. radiata]|uniref:Peroxisome biogenesis factor 10 isoform X1 n=2 Tax=Vigna radiata var. radiata TaxID=3916 RepID=A0A1S3TIS7_VIGRR|nr:peroxisome biogenesis factor 10 isoform X1 [Vigna radiata var. radiata]
MWQNQANHSSYSGSVKALEDDIQHANSLALSLPGDCDGNCFQMKLSYSPFAPLFLHLIQWLDLSCTDTLPVYLGLLHILIFNVYADGIPSISSNERKATIKEFYAVIYPSLRLLQGEFNNDRRHSYAEVNRKRLEKVQSKDLEGDEECGICMENNMKMVLPNCGHSFCISCFHDWYMRSESCPFCRGSMRRISPADLWMVIGNSDVVDSFTIAKDNLRRLYLFIQTLPPILAEPHLLYTFNYML